MSEIGWTDPDDGTIWELRYVVGQGHNERDHMEYRVKGLQTWQEAPPFCEPPAEAAEFWFGPMHGGKDRDLAVEDDLKSTVQNLLNLVADLKRLGVIEPGWVPALSQPDSSPGPQPANISEIPDYDGSEYAISYYGRKSEGGWEMANESVIRYSESPLNFAEEIERHLMELVNEPGSTWTRHDVVAWITNLKDEDHYTMTWSQADAIVTMNRLTERGFDQEEHFQGIQDKMSTDGEQFAVRQK
jgi:nucleoside 2-deoxyribosyltransferase